MEEEELVEEILARYDEEDWYLECGRGTEVVPRIPTAAESRMCGVRYAPRRIDVSRCPIRT